MNRAGDRARARLPLPLAALLGVLLAAGCSWGAEMEALGARLQEAGYTEIGVGHVNTNGYDLVQVEATKPAADDNGVEIARLVWHTYAEEVDQVAITLNGTTRSATRDELLEEFGPRQLDPNPDEDTDPVDVLIRVAVVILVIVVLVKVLGFLGRLGRGSGPGRL
ncbi:hypothetical protein ACFXGA_20540 [Actinosynnema sp. NPDC059335]|uniref:hypothetical protein n=1 Tax=Actinosynnema sp. NPDC059335 TaxID=3346804 RepID=UPI00366D4F0D